MIKTLYKEVPEAFRAQPPGYQASQLNGNSSSDTLAAVKGPCEDCVGFKVGREAVMECCLLTLMSTLSRKISCRSVGKMHFSADAKSNGMER